MALTPEDVVNKRFNPTKFREGYDQDEVDDFLDEVVVELRRLNQENEELRQRLVAGESRLAELQRSAAQQAQMPQQAPMPAPVPEQPAFAPAGFDPNAMDPGNTNNLLQLARRLHEEHVREGMEKRDALIAEGHAAAARVVSEAEQGARGQLGALQQEKNELERKVEELRQFERDYRTKLRGYIEGQLRELETSNALSAAPAQQAVAAAPQAAAPQYDAPQAAAPQYAAAPAYGQPQQPDYAAYPQPTEYPGFGSGN
ncbi:DivIVA domain-containing protein [Pseudolysinimonas sp.]|uniref:DivIVA domain-containing protein n=1 Tax=Pseudolysinimonas sp. TaxID=2680009 RepID=UPI0037839890